MKPEECSPRKNKISNLMGKLKSKKVQTAKNDPCHRWGRNIAGRGPRQLKSVG